MSTTPRMCIGKACVGCKQKSLLYRPTTVYIHNGLYDFSVKTHAWSYSSSSFSFLVIAGGRTRLPKPFQQNPQQQQQQCSNSSFLCYCSSLLYYQQQQCCYCEHQQLCISCSSAGGTFILDLDGGNSQREIQRSVAVCIIPGRTVHSMDGSGRGRGECTHFTSSDTQTWGIHIHSHIDIQNGSQSN